MRLLTTGSRSWEGVWGESRIGQVLMSVEVLSVILKSPLVILHGGNPKGADAVVDRWARRRDVELEVHEALWSTYGKRAGPIRNGFMVNQGVDLCIGFLRNNSPGTLDCMRQARWAHIPTFCVDWEETDVPRLGPDL